MFLESNVELSNQSIKRTFKLPEMANLSVDIWLKLKNNNANRKKLLKDNTTKIEQTEIQKIIGSMKKLVSKEFNIMVSFNQ